MVRLIMSEVDFSNYKTCQLIQRDKEPIIVVERAQATAAISLRGGQILSYIQQGQPPVFWHNDHADYQSGHAIRQGAPICWPWFGALEKNPEPVRMQFAGHSKSAPQHGLVRGQVWQLVWIREHSQITEIALLSKLSDPDISLMVKYYIGSEFHMELITENNSQQDFNFSCALHSYFAVSDVTTVTVTGLESGSYYDTLQNWQLLKQRGGVTFNQEVDRVYVDTPSIICIEDSGWQRQITVECEDSQSAVVWNPWRDKSLRLSQFSPQSYLAMVCVETAKVLKDSISLPAAQAHRLLLKIKSTSCAI